MSGPYCNLNPAHRRPSPWSVFRWAIGDPLTGKRKKAPPGSPAPSVNKDLTLIRDPSGPDCLTWIGHASFLGTLQGNSFLIDPVFSKRIATFFPRYGSPGLLPEDLPRLDAVLISHNHYDHLDRASIQALSNDVPVIVPQGLGRWFHRQGMQRVIELNWWESTQIGPLHITLVPARHWSRRTLWDTNWSLWGGFVIEGGERTIYHAGDTAWFEGFEEIGRRFPRLDVALLPAGAYEPAWFMENNHLNPEQTGEAFLQLGARLLVPMHWGTFQLTDEPLIEPAERLRFWWDRRSSVKGRQLHIPHVGETLVIEG